MNTAFLTVSILLSAASAQDPPVLEPTAKTVHVFVALCDNEHQGIVPVPKLIGDGDDPRNNLYWGALYGAKTFLKKSDSWRFVSEQKSPRDAVLERMVFKHATKDVYLVADAYRGARIKDAVTEFLRAAGGHDGASLKVGDDVLNLSGCADLIAYVGHNGLMDFSVAPEAPVDPDGGRQAMVLACKSRQYFESRLVASGCRPVLLTTGFMAPEAYTLDAAVCAWASGQPGPTIRERAAAAYHEYQKCGMSGARRLFHCGE
ncbi:MAG: hypothetical protein GY851_31050 [bacterium]|nr:hypothetical protein [bacterium]